MTGHLKGNSINIVIRPMIRSDISRIVLIENMIFSDPWPTAAFEEELDRMGRGIIVAETDGVVAGYAGYIVGAGESHLTNMGVAPEYQRKSVAKILLNGILEIADRAECDYIFLDVRPSNTAALNLYGKFGFTQLYRRPGYYRFPDEDAVVMIKTLGNE
ncbi:MAG: ribosomal protein S18-alanine N-acetyltransferase [candidate division Zixibacteria bacterium]|nr:ribosomal protein S18-alanine N-acetyltransferase [candidate division Zixibacteria bacterium]